MLRVLLPALCIVAALACPIDGVRFAVALLILLAMPHSIRRRDAHERAIARAGLRYIADALNPPGRQPSDAAAQQSHDDDSV